MDDPVIVECHEEFDPPMVRVIIGSGSPNPVSFDVPAHDYRRISMALGLPDLICPRP